MLSSLLLCREVQDGDELTQRELAQRLKTSLGRVNSLIQTAEQYGWLSRKRNGRHLRLTDKGHAKLDEYRVDNAIILAAGFGSRFVPLTYDTPKGLLKVHGQPMLERQIEQLLAVGVSEIYLVVGYMKEAFDYLIDKYGVTLIFNPAYASKNNLASLYLARQHLKNSYILVSDHYLEDNIFHRQEFFSWYCCSQVTGKTLEWYAQATQAGRIEKIIIGGTPSEGLALIGPAFIDSAHAQRFRELLEEHYHRPDSDFEYWEHILVKHINELELWVNDQTGRVWEFENLEELRAYDPSYLLSANSAILDLIAKHFAISPSAITSIEPLKAGMTNQSFLFSVDGQRYVFRQPGAGTEKLINRAYEKRAYECAQETGLPDELVYFDGSSGIKISRYYENARVADPFDDGDLEVSMRLIRRLHDYAIKPPHSFDIERLIVFYRGLAQDLGAIRFADIADVNQKIDRLLHLRQSLAVPEVLCHADPVPTNILFLPDGSNRLIDWEYSGGGDPLMDVAMYAIYSYFDRLRSDLALYLYLGHEPDRQQQARLYLYIALGGFLWSMWTEYKQGLGVEFGDYGMVMYRYAKDYYAIVTNEGFFNDLEGN
jgi:CTP:phosphocholine cytidylyltransferase-like protein/thiamine kinase-like enzyme